MANRDQVVAHRHIIDQALANAAQGAFLPVKERDLYNLDPQLTVLGELDPTYQGPIFPDFSLEEPDLESIMGDLVPQEIQTRILVAVKQSHTNNQQMVQLLDSKIRSLYTAASGLVNDRDTEGLWPGADCSGCLPAVNPEDVWAVCQTHFLSGSSS